MKSDLDKVLVYCKQWGVPVVLEDEYTFSGERKTREYDSDFHRGPRYGFIHWPKRTIYWPSSTLAQDTTRHHALLHELSHCLDPLPPNLSEEVTGQMLAFEFYSSRYLNLAGWSDWMTDYGLSEEGQCWSKCNTKIRGEYVRCSLRVAVENGVLTRSGRPTFVKKKYFYEET